MFLSVRTGRRLFSPWPANCFANVWARIVIRLIGFLESRHTIIKLHVKRNLQLKLHHSIGFARAFVMLFAVAFVTVTVSSPILEDSVSSQADTSVCARTVGIREAIVAAVIESGAEGVDGCEDVTGEHLAAITGLPGLVLSGPTNAENRLRSAPKSFDLKGLTSLNSLYLANHDLGSLPARFFEDNTAIMGLDLQVAKLSTLPAGVFDPLTSLVTLRIHRNFFVTFPEGLKTITQANFPDLITLTLGLEFRNPVYHFETLPSGWVANLPTGLTELRLNYIKPTDAEAATLASRLTVIQTLSFDYGGMTFNGFIRMFESLSPSLQTLIMTGDKLGVWHADATEQQKTELADALARLSLETLYIEDTTITSDALDAILDGLQPTAESVTVRKGNLVGFTGESLADYTNLETLDLQDNNLTEQEFVQLVANLVNTPIRTLILTGNNFDKGANYIDLTKFDFTTVLDTLASLKLSPYFSCQGPWIEDYIAAGFDLTDVNVDPDPEAEPDQCVEPVEVVEEEEEEEPEQPTKDTSRILRIEPAATSVRMRPDELVLLSTNVYGLQDSKDNTLADRVGPDKVRFEWDEPKHRNRFTESTFYETRRNSQPDDREVLYQSPSSPGRYYISANIPHTAGCRGPKGDETAEEAEARCTAIFEIVVRLQHDVETPTEAPVNPSGLIPKSIAVDTGEACPVFTPEEGGKLEMSRYSVTAQPGAVQNGSYIAICVKNSGVASNAGMTHQRYTLQGDRYDISVFDSNGNRLSEYRLNTFVEACLPLPNHLRHQISDVELAIINRDTSQTVLSSTVVFAGERLRVCGPISTLPATVAVGVEGSPDVLPTPTPEPEEPVTGGSAPDIFGLLAIFIIGTAIVAVGALSLRRSRRST